MPWSAWIHTGFHVYGVTQDPTRSARVFRYGTLTLFGRVFHRVLLTVAFHIVVLQPHQDKSRWFGLFRVRSPLLTESILFLFLRLLRCFTSPRVTLPALCIQAGVIPLARDWVAPFGNLRIKACVPLPEAYRSLLRPSSPDDAKASINCCNWFMQTLIILGVYLTYLHAKLSKNKIVLLFNRPSFSHLVPTPKFIFKWWAQMDLNHRPRAYQARALTN